MPVAKSKLVSGAVRKLSVLSRENSAVAITILICIFCFEAVARGLDYRLSFADVPVIRLLFNHNLRKVTQVKFAYHGPCPKVPSLSHY